MKVGRVSVSPDESDVEPGGHLRLWALVNGVEIPIRDGQTVIGRSEECQISLRDTLVSRQHARILREGARLVLQDLGSSNGVFVNREKVEDRTEIAPGDTLYVGTTEIEICSDSDEDRDTESGVMVFDEDRPTPVSHVSSPAMSSVPSSVPASGQRRSSIPRGEDEDDDSTSVVDAFEYLGRLADKMFTMGRSDAAKQILSGHLDAIITEARSGKSMDPEMITLAGRYSLKLAVATLDGKWVDVAVELHLIAGMAFREDMVQQLASLRSKAPLGDDSLLRQYTQQLRSRMASLSEGERLLIERIACLERQD